MLTRASDPANRSEICRGAAFALWDKLFARPQERAEFVASRGKARRAYFEERYRERYQQIFALDERGMTLSDIAAEVGVHYASVSKILRRYGRSRRRDNTTGLNEASA